MSNNVELDIKKLIVKTCRLSIEPDVIQSEQELFGADGLNLDSIDALQIVVAIARDYDIDVPEEKMPELTTVSRIANFINLHNQSVVSQ